LENAASAHTMRPMKAALLLLILSVSCLGNPTKVVILGDSLTEGYGVAKEAAYPALVQEKFRKAGKVGITVVNGGIGGSTTASAEKRMAWHLKSKPQAVLIALGANDALRGLKVEASRESLRKAIRLAKGAGAKVLLAGMRVPPNYGAEFVREFEGIFPALAKAEKLPLLPFLLEGVAGNPTLNQTDGIHPNEKGHQIIADKVFTFLESHL
jgi:acyl-CoA thioesterase I